MIEPANIVIQQTSQLDVLGNQLEVVHTWQQYKLISIIRGTNWLSMVNPGNMTCNSLANLLNK